MVWAWASLEADKLAEQTIETKSKWEVMSTQTKNLAVLVVSKSLASVDPH